MIIQALFLNYFPRILLKKPEHNSMSAILWIWQCTTYRIIHISLRYIDIIYSRLFHICLGCTPSSSRKDARMRSSECDMLWQFEHAQSSMSPMTEHYANHICHKSFSRAYRYIYIHVRLNLLIHYHKILVNILRSRRSAVSSSFSHIYIFHSLVIGSLLP